MAATPTFSDNFTNLSLWNGNSGTWNTNYWYNALTGNGGSLPTNGEQEWYINSNDPSTSSIVPWTVQNGILTITGSAAPSSIQPLINGYQYVSGELNSYHSFSQLYGFFEARMQLPAGQGLWPAFWMIPENGSWPPEIDIMEMLGNDPSTYYTSVHSGTASAEVSAGQANKVADTSKAYHEFAVDWTPTTLTYYFDNKPVYSTPTPSDMNVPMYMELNLAMGGGWPGNINSTTPLPAQMRVANVQAYASNPNPIGTSTTYNATGATGQVYVGSPGNDVFNVGMNSVVMTGDGLTNTYIYNALPTAASHVTDFDPGTDAIDISALLQSAGYTGTNPINDGTITVVSNGSGGSEIVYNHSGAHTAIVELDNVDPSQILNSDFAYAGGSSSGGAGTSVNDPSANGTPGQILTANAPNATFQAGQNSVVMTEDGGSNTFVYTALPYNAGQITNFNPVSDKIDVSAMLKAVGYAGSNPFGDGTLTINSDGHGGAYLMYNPPGVGSNGVWPITVVDIDNIAPSSLNTSTDFVTGYGVSHSGSYADFYGSGSSGILWQNGVTGQTVVWKMNGATPVENIVATVPTAWSAVGIGDFNGDGYADILWQNAATAQVAIWEMSGGQPAVQQTIATVPSGWKAAGVADFNRDGEADILWQNRSTDQIAIWEMNGTTPIVEQTISTFPGTWYVAGVGNFYGTGQSDILWENAATHEVAIWHMNGTTAASETTIATVPAGWQIVGVGDFNGDGISDILWQNRSTQQVAIWEMNGGAPVSETNVGTMADNWKVAEVGHFNGAGNSGILWQNTSTGALSLWTLNGATLTDASSVTTVSSSWHPDVTPNGQLPSVAYDFYGAGTADILWQNTSTGQLALWQMTGTTPIAESNFATVSAGWSPVGVGDFYGHGQAAVLWENSSTGQISVWKMNGASMEADQPIATVSSSWHVAGIGDFNADGNSDIAWWNSSAHQIAIWEMNGASPLLEQTIATVPDGWQIAGTGNFYGPGTSDILWENSSTNQIAVWEMNGTSAVAQQTIATVPLGWKVAGTGDFYGNGYDDILWFNSLTHQVAMWEMHGATPLAETTIATLPSGWNIAEVGHITGASNADILWQNSTTGQVALWQMDGPTPVAETTFATAPAGWHVADQILMTGH